MTAAPSKPLQVALIGNPNTGKTTLFNRLTGLRQRVGNFPGVTVEKVVGKWHAPNGVVEFLDLPGAYSLSANSRDEAIVVEALCGRFRDIPRPDLVLCVVDASNLQRHLFLVSQLTDLDLPLILILNQWDVVEKKQIRIDLDQLAARLEIPIFPTTASKNRGIDAVKQALDQILTGGDLPHPKPIAWPVAIESATALIQDRARADSGQDLQPAEARRILFDAQPVLAAEIGWNLDACRSALDQARGLVQEAGFHPLAAESLLHYQRIRGLLEGLIQHPAQPIRSGSEKLDHLLTHRVWGLLFFFTVMFLVFRSVYTWAGPIMDWIDGGTQWLQGVADGMISNPVLNSLLVDGVLAGVGSVIIFLPQILILFLFIAILEDTGYMARAAFLMDRLFSWCGLNGKSFVPMLTSYACAIPGLMSTRTIEDPKARLTTILISPLMSCSARLPVYVLLIGTFVEPAYGPTVAALCLFAFHLLGLAVAVPIAWAINRFWFKTQRRPFVLEMPAYRRPRLRNSLWRMFAGGRSFLARAGTMILGLTVLLWFLSYFPRDPQAGESVRADVIAEIATAQSMTEPEVEAVFDAGANEAWTALYEHRIDAHYLENSYLGQFGRTVQPIFAPAGFDWKITVGVLASFPAREVIIATLGMLYHLGSDVDEESTDLRENLTRALWENGPRAGQPVFTIPVALAIMVFFALCMQCGATLVTLARESHWKWSALTFVYMTTLAWIGAVTTYQLTRLFL
ncbi:MAG: ferrous iron transport protein B [Verrucomicrobia bacterium]|nr:ferrous iron transport protein B [Verrucomicrobiota bacterium]